MKADPALVDHLRRASLFGGLSDKCLVRIASEMRQHDFAVGDVVFGEGDGAGFGRMYLILDGTARVSVGDSELARYEPGDCFGEMSVLDGRPRSATVTATSALRTMSLTSWSMRSLIKEHPEIAQHLIDVLVARLRSTDDRFQD